MSPDQNTQPKAIRIGDRMVGPGHPAYIVAELSGNHNGSLERALETVRAAAKTGADAIKLQTYTADTMTIRSSDPSFKVPGDGPWGGRELYSLYEEAHTPWDWHPALFDEAKKHGLDIFSTPFDSTAVEFLEKLGVPAYKIASFEMTDDPLVRLVGSRGKPVIISTGMASVEEIAHARDTLARAGATEVIFLKCTSSYPAPDASMRLATIPMLSAVTGGPVGLSDHSMGATASVVAVTLGACLIEKHFTLSRADGGVDSHFSLEPAEFTDLVRDVRRAEAMIGQPAFGAGAAEEGNIAFRRSMYAVAPIAAGEALTPANIRAIRPGFGLSPRYADILLGARASRAIPAGTPLSWKDVTG
jgi:N-acetylneuraminate synthase